MAAKTQVKRCKYCGRMSLKSYAKYHSCEQGVTWFPHAKEREQARLRRQGRA